MLTNPKTAIVAASVAMAAGCAQAQVPAAHPVLTGAGLVEGAAPDAQGVTAYKGIPYAAAPVGALRWRPPQPPLPWAGVRQATSFGPACWAAAPPGPARPGLPQSEDCLTVNVWAPQAGGDAKKPVMVWVHGGGFAFGSSSEPRYDGSRLAARGVVVVTLNYRLGVFGFLAHPSLDAEHPGSGAFGLQDQVAALRWVKGNVGAFGGDPGNVTLFGESAGAHAVGLLMTSPQAAGLFQKAIVQSGAFWDSTRGSIITHAEVLEQGKALAARLGGGDVARLRAIPADQLNAATAWDFKSDPSGTAFAPSLDGHLLPDSPAAAFGRGAQRDVPLLGGWNAVEDLPFRALALPHATPQEFEAAAAKMFGDGRMTEFRALYPARDPAETLVSANILVGDVVISEQTWQVLGLQRRAGHAPVFAYQFSYTSPYSPIASHVADVPFVFGNFTPQFFAPQAPAPGEADRRMSDLMMSYWTNFAVQGDPNGPGLPSWPGYEGPGSTVMHLRADAVAGPESGTDRLRFIASFRREGRFPDAWRTLGAN